MPTGASQITCRMPNPRTPHLSSLPSVNRTRVSPRSASSSFPHPVPFPPMEIFSTIPFSRPSAVSSLTATIQMFSASLSKKRLNWNSQSLEPEIGQTWTFGPLSIRKAYSPPLVPHFQFSPTIRIPWMQSSLCPFRLAHTFS